MDSKLIVEIESIASIRSVKMQNLIIRYLDEDGLTYLSKCDVSQAVTYLFDRP